MDALEDTVLSLGKSVVDRAVSYAESAVTKEVALQLGVHRDQDFIADELEMMQGFLMAAHDERDRNEVVKSWVKQVRDVAYDVEDCLQDFAVRIVGRRPSWCWWRIPRTLLDRHRVAKKMKKLRVKVDDVSQRNMRYHLINGPAASTKPATSSGDGEQRAVMASATMYGVGEARRQRDQAKADLVALINGGDDHRRVISVWGSTSAVLGETTIIERAYEDVKMHTKNFECCAWITLMHPFDRTKFLQSIVRQLYVNHLRGGKQRENETADAQALRSMGAMNNEDDLANEFKSYVNEKSYLIVLDDVHTVEEWRRIEACFPHNKKRSRMIVSTKHAEVASLCVGPENVEPEHKQWFADLYAFYDKVSQDGTDLREARSSSNTASNSTEVKSPVGIEGTVAALKDSKPIGRDEEKHDIAKLIINEDSRQLEVISVWGMGGLGKTTLVRDIYQTQELIGKFEKRACVTIMRPFSSDELLESLVKQMDDEESKKREENDRMMTSKKKPEVDKSPEDHEENKRMMTGKKKSPPERLAYHLEGKKYLIVLDDLLSTTEWDSIKSHFPATATASRIIITTRLKNVAEHCSKKQNICILRSLGAKDACDLFTQKYHYVQFV